MAKVEYLIPINTSSGMFKTKKSIVSYLNANEKLNVTDTEIVFKQQTFAYKCSLNIINSQNLCVLQLGKLTVKHVQRLILSDS